jgi:phytoene synthase
MALELDADRRLALTYVPARRRAAVEALWRLDVALASVVATGREPLISQIRLTWWREALETLDRESAPAEPVLQALKQHVLPLRAGGAELAEMETGWSVLLSPGQLSAEQLGSYAAARGGLLFRLSARLLGGEAEGVDAGGEAWALIDLARNSANQIDSDAARAAALIRARASRGRWPTSLRPLGMLAMLAARDAQRVDPAWEVHGSPGRMLRMLRHRITGG